MLYFNIMLKINKLLTNFVSMNTSIIIDEVARGNCNKVVLHLSKDEKSSHAI